MTTAGSSPGHIDIGGILSEATDTWKKSFATIWVIALILIVPVAILGYFATKSMIINIIYAIAALVVSLYLQGVLSRIVQDVREDGKVDWSVGELLKSINPKLLPLLGLSIVVGILVTIGLIFFIIPGVILALMWLVAVPVMIIEDKGVFDSMSRSGELTKSNRWRLLGLIIVIYIGVFVVFFIAGLIAAVLPILGVIAVIVLAVIVYPWLGVVAPTAYYALLGSKGEVAGTMPAPGTAHPGGEPPAPAA
ncbi:MAG: glycerophosphoryl diester phosphodiesterase membrane domain-containing protein [Acidobacteria bacterium]|nr:glycerophosphoryl diester phosphodiesterase membrane domain-containing protein [Acidobacteriota bacterium]